MHIGILSTFPPEPCGIGAYAEQQARRLEAEGHAVTRIPLQDLRRGGWHGSAWQRALETLSAADRVIVHYQVNLFRDESLSDYWRQYLRPHRELWRLCRRARGRVEMVVHESYFAVVRNPLWLVPQYLVALRTFLLPRTLIFHTAHELNHFRRRFPRRNGLERRPHEADFSPFANTTQEEARAQLGLAQDELVFLCIGFYGAAKGFEQFASAFEEARRHHRLSDQARLHVVTSVRRPEDAAGHAALAALVQQHATHPAIRIHPGFVSDDVFDRWLVASDIVVLPYLSSYSSGVAARAHLFGKRMLAAHVGGLGEQVTASDILYKTETELQLALARLGR